jgi:hypothetical protein
MKKLLQGSIVLTLFAISIFLFQISCRKDAVAQNSQYTLPVATNSTLGGVIVGQGLSIDNSGVLSCSRNDVILYFKMTSPRYEWWVCDRDGGNQRMVNFPSTITVTNLGVSLLSDKNTVVFSGAASTIPLGVSDLYTMNIDGSNLHKIVSNSGVNLTMPVAYW